MKFLDKNTILKRWSTPTPAVLEEWCQKNNFLGVEPTRYQGDTSQSDHIMAAALWYSSNKYPDGENMDVCSFAGLIAYLATGWYSGFGTEEYDKERRAENIIVGLAGGTLVEPSVYYVPSNVAEGTPSEAFTNRALDFLEKFYFEDEERAVADLMSKNALHMVRIGEVMTVSEVAAKYGITSRAVQKAIKEGKMAADEYVETTSGILISRSGAERLWRKKGD